MAGDFFGGFCCFSYALIALAWAIAAVYFYLRGRKKEKDLVATMKQGKSDNV